MKAKMALYPPAEKRLLHPGLNHSVGGMGTIHGVIVHVIVGSLAAADSVFHNPSRSASAHFGVGKDGHVVQWVDTKDKAWAEGAGNSQWISVETEGYPNEALTNAQLTAVGAIVRWAHDLYHFPLQVTDSTTGQGVGTHSMGGAAWGGHACPGFVRAAQRTNIVNIAAGVPAPAPQPGPVPGPAGEDMGVIIQCKPASMQFGNDAKMQSGWFFAAVDRVGPYKWHVSSGRLADELVVLGHASNTERDAQGHIRPRLVDESIFDAYV